MADKTCEQAEQSAMDRLTHLGLMAEASRHLVTAMVEARDEETAQLRAERDTANAKLENAFKLLEKYRETTSMILGQRDAANATIREVDALLSEYEAGDWGARGTLDKIRAALDASHRPEDTDETRERHTPVAGTVCYACDGEPSPCTVHRSLDTSSAPESPRDAFGHLPDCPSGSQFLGDDPACHCARTHVAPESPESEETDIG